MNTPQNSTPPTSADEAAQPVPNLIEVKDLEPEQDVSGGMRCQNNLKQLGIG